MKEVGLTWILRRNKSCDPKEMLVKPTDAQISNKSFCRRILHRFTTFIRPRIASVNQRHGSHQGIGTPLLFDEPPDTDQNCYKSFETEPLIKGY